MYDIQDPQVSFDVPTKFDELNIKHITKDKTKKRNNPIYFLKGWTFKSLPGSTPVTIDALRIDNCRWPIDDSETEATLYCGLSIVDSTYCACHWKLARPIDNSEKKRFNKFIETLIRA